MISRRQMMTQSAALAASGVLLLGNLQEAAAEPESSSTRPGEPGVDYTPVVTPNGSTLPWKLVNGAKAFHLVAEEIEHEFAPGLRATCWGYNGQTPGPTIEAVEGDRVRFYVTNRLPEPTSVHWHGIRVPNGMDGVTGLVQPPIPPGQTFKYEFTLRQHGTFMYHPHFDEMTQQAMGLMGMFIIHPRHHVGPKIDRDFVLMLSEWKIEPGARRPNPIEMTDFNLFTMNSKVFPATEPLVVRLSQRVRIRFGNLGATDHHPIHLHGYDMLVTETDGGALPETARYRVNTILVPVGSTRALEIVANEPGDWAMHCHMTHHVMNQMGHNIPNMIGVDPAILNRRIQPLLPEYMTMGETGMGEMANMGMHMPIPPNSIAMRTAQGPFGVIDMGGMFTILKVHPGITRYENVGWYQHPPGTVASPVSPEELAAAGIHVPPGAVAPTRPSGTMQHHH